MLSSQTVTGSGSHGGALAATPLANLAAFSLPGALSTGSTSPSTFRPWGVARQTPRRGRMGPERPGAISARCVRNFTRSLFGDLWDNHFPAAVTALLQLGHALVTITSAPVLL
ncbi:MAG: hypothetical protein M3179_05810 [Actinomycetota bacterium]|nr:hypothetical protein [Actinomycetota bacterium]